MLKEKSKEQIQNLIAMGRSKEGLSAHTNGIDVFLQVGFRLGFALWQGDVHRLAEHGKGEHEEDQQEEDHVDQRGHVHAEFLFPDGLNLDHESESRERGQATVRLGTGWVYCVPCRPDPLFFVSVSPCIWWTRNLANFSM